MLEKSLDTGRHKKYCLIMFHVDYKAPQRMSIGPKHWELEQNTQRLPGVIDSHGVAFWGVHLPHKVTCLACAMLNQ